MSWFVYMLRCNDDTLYTGITTDLNRRVLEHNGESKISGAKYTKSRRPVKLVYEEKAINREVAQQREYAIKQLTRKQKRLLIDSGKK